VNLYNVLKVISPFFILIIEEEFYTAILLLIQTQFLYMDEPLIAAIAIYCVVMVSFYLMGTPPVWACIFGVIASCISYRCKLK